MTDLWDYQVDAIEKIEHTKALYVLPTGGGKTIIANRLIERAVFRHGLLEDRIEWTLDVTKRAENPTHARRDQQKTSRLVECSQCGAVRTAGEACEHCGFLPKPRPDAIIFRDGDLGLVDPNSRIVLASSDPNERMRWHSMLTYIAAERGYHPGWISHKYREKFGCWPPVRHAGSQEPTPEVRSWVRSRDIAWAKAKQKTSEAA